ncbi:hypothetical protein DLAC_05620 [Tieghemostelium lacteum]|uniref:EGF-like domain-containing protein n=1 Tax=Tieghemostelium lacteum TaxID=361077 RepID=A0A151ZGG1_TIELA|nr:hypothetical protein DLAC_05620 [Tieghemostelium lacteum]|eukprot:KYQ93015.1 hypothetical protein DLAC_05620 [Tieghemostelium lacteum]
MDTNCRASHSIILLFLLLLINIKCYSALQIIDVTDGTKIKNYPLDGSGFCTFELMIYLDSDNEYYSDYTFPNSIQVQQYLKDFKKTITRVTYTLNIGYSLALISVTPDGQATVSHYLETAYPCYPKPALSSLKQTPTVSKNMVGDYIVFLEFLDSISADFDYLTISDWQISSNWNVKLLKNTFANKQGLLLQFTLKSNSNPSNIMLNIAGSGIQIPVDAFSQVSPFTSETATILTFYLPTGYWTDMDQVYGTFSLNTSFVGNNTCFKFTDSLDDTVYSDDTFPIYNTPGSVVVYLGRGSKFGNDDQPQSGLKLYQFSNESSRIVNTELSYGTLITPTYQPAPNTMNGADNLTLNLTCILNCVLLSPFGQCDASGECTCSQGVRIGDGLLSFGCTQSCGLPCTSTMYGFCNSTTGSCNCTQGTLAGDGYTCIQDCYPPCQNGTCNAGVCQCNSPGVLNMNGYQCDFTCMQPCDSAHGFCNLTTGQCQCNTGTLDGNGYTCNVPCNPPCQNGTCGAGGVCGCPAGSSLNGNGYQCDFPCAQTCSSFGFCNTTLGSCQCNQGTLDTDGVTCLVNCPSPCNGGYCDMTLGECKCNSPGYLDGDGHTCIFPCETPCIPPGFCNGSIPACQSPYSCEETYGSDGVCTCAPPRTLSSNGYSCETTTTNCAYNCINYCDYSSGNCVPFTTCQQFTEGDGSCSCHTGTLQPDGYSCLSLTCNPSCQGTCSLETEYICVCPYGYRLQNDGYTCTNIDECQEQLDQCQYQCIDNTPGYDCSCPPNYDLVNQYQCQFNDPCPSMNCETNCGYNETLNQAFCYCSHGYRIGVDGRSCEAINPCVDDPNLCTQCRMTSPGSYECYCDQVDEILAQDQKTCIKIHQCSYQNGFCEQECENGQEFNTVNCSCSDSDYKLNPDNQTCSLITPEVLSIEYIQIPKTQQSVVVRIEIKSDKPIRHIKMSNSIHTIYLDVSDITFGDDLHGIYERRLDLVNIPTDDFVFTITTESTVLVLNDKIFNINAVYKSIPKYPCAVSFDPSMISDFQFHTSSAIELSTSSGTQRLTFKIVGGQDIPTSCTPRVIVYPSNIPSSLKYLDSQSPSPKSSLVFYGKWDVTLSRYQIDMQLPARLYPGLIDYTLVLGSSQFTSSVLYQFLGSSSQFSVYSSEPYQMPLTISAIHPFPSNQIVIPSGSAPVDIGFKIEISESPNGFKSGRVQIVSEKDLNGYWFDITNVNQTLTITIPNSICRNQVFRLKTVRLEDGSGHVSDSSISHYINPLMVVTPVPTIELICQSGISYDFEAPKITQFTLSKTSVDVGSSTPQSITFTMKLVDELSGINPRLLPSVLLGSAVSDNTFSVPCKFDSVVSNTTVILKCTSVLPYGFAHPSSIQISVIDIYDNLLNMRTYSSLDLSTALLPNSLNTTNSKLPRLDTLQISGDVMTLHGQRLIRDFLRNTTNYQVKVDYHDGQGYRTTPVIFASGLEIQCRLLMTNTPVTVFLQYNNIRSNQVEYSQPQCPSANGLVCNGRGVCQVSTLECLCQVPYSGIDCTSEIVMIPKPIMSETKPSMSSDYQVTDSNSGKTIHLVSDISIHSLLELDVNKQKKQEFIFDQWTRTVISPKQDQYSYTLPNKTPITVTVTWFDQESTLQFANRSVNMKPSSVKYNISIGKYPFASQLNSLQLVMSSQFQTDQTGDSCSKQSFNTDEQQENEYMKLQVNQHSLYGRFIKRAIVDTNRVVMLSSQPIQSESSANSSKSLIGINIPHYNDNLLIDPDFSVLVETKPVAKDDTESTCGTSSESDTKSGLSASQIAGIAIGCGLVLIGAIVIISALVFKRFRHSKVVLTVRGKLSRSLSKF